MLSRRKDNNVDSDDESSIGFSDSSEESLATKLDAVWEELDWDQSFSSAPPKFKFSKLPTTKPNFKGRKSILNCFELFFYDVLVKSLCRDLNQQGRAENGKRIFCNGNEWDDVNVSEFKVYIALVMLQGIMGKPFDEDYWTKKPALNVPNISQPMSLKRFEKFTSYLHKWKKPEVEKDSDSEDDDTDSEDEDIEGVQYPYPISERIWVICTLLQTKFSEHFSPDRVVYFEESYCKKENGFEFFCGVTLPKLTRSCVQLFTIRDRESGYVCSMLLTSDTKMTINDEFRDHPRSIQAVMTAMKPFLNRGHCLAINNKHCSVKLGSLLSDHSTDVLFKLSELPSKFSHLIEKNYQSADSLAMVSKNIMISLYKKYYVLISTIHIDDSVTPESRAKEYGKTLGKMKTNRLKAYNKSVRNEKRLNKLFFHMVELAAWNAYVLMHKDKSVRSFTNCKIDLIGSMLIKYHKPNGSDSPRCGPSNFREIEPRLAERHFPEFLNDSGFKNLNKQKCIVCYKTKKETTKYKCSECQVPLCAVPCFKIYHTTDDLTNI